MKNQKYLSKPAYGSIPHLPNSRVGPSDRSISTGHADICCNNSRGRTIIVQEKLDGSCVAVHRDGDELVPLIRAGYHARQSPREQHHLFADWVERHATRIRKCIASGERIVGEWLAQAHGTRYLGISEDGPCEPFVAFDVFSVTNQRLTHLEFVSRVAERLDSVGVLAVTATPVDVAMRYATMLARPLLDGEQIEGVVYRAESGDAVEFLCKYVQPTKVDGQYLECVTGGEPVWNWRPELA